ncbi:MAG: D-alanyl-D-alanine carboxypeptidase [Clostridia bacterium]|nr:D-alanyl-D-alanine carboxypeptidase [Clostridia bacterium]
MRDNRLAVIIMILMICIMIMMMTIVASADLGFSLSARSAALYIPQTGEFVYSKNIDERLPMASTTKIMTALIAIEAAEMTELVEIPAEACGIEGSSLYLEGGDILTVADLLYALLLQSANDAATALALKVGGDIATFSEMMNERAAVIGLSDTHFDNPHGLDSSKHYTTAHDLAMLAAEAMKNDSFREIVSTYKYSFNVSDKPRTVVNHNKLLKKYEGVIGVKTGYTKKSGRCLVSCASRDGLELIAVTLDAPDDWRDHAKLFDLGFDRYVKEDPRCLSDTLFTVPVFGSEKTSVRAEVDDLESLSLIRLRSEKEYRAIVDIKPYTSSPIKVGDKLGEIIYMQGNEEIARRNILAIDTAEKNKQKFNLFDLFIQ